MQEASYSSFSISNGRLLSKNQLETVTLKFMFFLSKQKNMGLSNTKRNNVIKTNVLICGSIEYEQTKLS